MCTYVCMFGCMCVYYRDELWRSMELAYYVWIRDLIFLQCNSLSFTEI